MESESKIQNRTPMTCPVCYRPEKILSTHLKRKCMRLNTEKERKACLESAKKRLMTIASKGTAIDYEEIVSLGSLLEDVVPFLEDRGFLIINKPTTTRNVRHKRTSTSVSAATSSLPQHVAAFQADPFKGKDVKDTPGTFNPQQDMEVARVHVKPEKEMEDVPALVKMENQDKEENSPGEDHGEGQNRREDEGENSEESVENPYSKAQSHNRTPMTCPFCYRPEKILSTHLKRKCMRLNTKEERKACLESAKKRLVTIASKGTAIDYEEIVSLGSLEDVVPFLEDRGFLIINKPTTTRNVRQKRTSSSVSAATSTLPQSVAASQAGPLKEKDVEDTFKPQQDLEVAQVHVEPEGEMEDGPALVNMENEEEENSPGQGHMEGQNRREDERGNSEESVENPASQTQSHNRTPMTCPVCYRTHKILSTHLKRKCMRLNTEEARKAALESSKKTLVNIASKGTVISFDEIMSLGSLENVVPFLEDRGFIITDKPTSNRNV
ncbi:uncharacterized protein LOC121004489 [Bufo bufo]|uniref:uncharacterized protein LOC121004489 n=1 Tax=Bufo bufo TaxID=8384 RepID=UPI001ABED387|nr:uncharacterized protein LOC121004489 [Bufo bufo]